MNLGYDGGNGSGSSDDKEEGKKSHQRHTNHQIQHLESVFKECPHPDHKQRQLISEELGMEPNQIKFWFQNKRNKIKVHNERFNNSSLKRENQRIQIENGSLAEALRNAICPSCSEHQSTEEERQQNLQKLRMENSMLKKEHERLSNLIANMTSQPVTSTLSLLPYCANSMELQTHNFLGSSISNIDFASEKFQNTTLASNLNGEQERDKSVMIKVALRAMDEVMELLRVDTNVSNQSPNDGKFVLQLHCYNNLFLKKNHRIEYSKDSCVVSLPGIQLLEMFLDSSKWVGFFSTIITKARTIEQIDIGKVGSSLQLMYEQMHILSPLVVPREFVFLRYCQQIDSNNWVVVDVSYDYLRHIQDTHGTPSRRLPSGYLIQNLPNGKTQVTWMERVEVDDSIQIHPLYRDLVRSCQAYGAKHWIATLQRMCERFSYSIMTSVTQPSLAIERGRRNLMKLSERMMKEFCAIINMSNKLDFPNVSKWDNSATCISTRYNNELGQHVGTTVIVSTSLWLPFSREVLFGFFKDIWKKPQWNALSIGNIIEDIVRIPCGPARENCVSIVKPSVPCESSSTMVLQESCIDNSVALVVYSPIKKYYITMTKNGGDTTTIPILPSGFTIYDDGHSISTSTSASSSKKGGSLLTMTFQMMRKEQSNNMGTESLEKIHSQIQSMVQKIKECLNSSQD